MGYFKNIAIEQEEQENPLVLYPMLEAHVLNVRGPLLDTTTDQALRDIKQVFDRLGPFEYAKRFGLLVNGSGEEFAHQFMSFWNNHRQAGTY